MSDWTGALYGFYTEKPIELVFPLLKKQVKEIGYFCDYHQYNEEQSLFFYKDEQMFNSHDEQGYNLNTQGKVVFVLKLNKLN